MSNDEPKKGGGPPSGTEPFLARWSRLKRAEAPAAAPPGSQSAEEASAAQRADPTPAPPVDPATLPSLDDLRPSDTIEAFLQEGVPEALKQMALRKAWALDPAIRDFIEVAENQYDWNAAGGVPGFGEIERGTDMARLLDQAVGRLQAGMEEIAPAPAGDGASAPATASALAPPAPGESVGVIPAPDVGGPTVAAAGQRQGGGPGEPAHDGRNAASLRRRHGGALPR